MYTSTLFAIASGALLAAASPIVRRESTYYGVGLEFELKFADGTSYYEPSPVQINTLEVVNATGIYGISVDPNSASHVDINTVECRAYKDADGVQPGSAPFSINSPARISTTGVEIGSVLCYIIELDQ